MVLLKIDGAIIITSAIALAAIILLLVLMLQVAAKRLVNQGDVKLTINGEKTIEVAAGTTLLNTLIRSIDISSVCLRWWWYMCAMCTCQVFEGGGDILTNRDWPHQAKRTKRELETGLPGQGEERHEDWYTRRNLWYQEMGV